MAQRKIQLRKTGRLGPNRWNPDRAQGDAGGPGPRTRVATALVERAWALKPDGRVFRGCAEPEAAALSMRAIGG
jgi:hypothetical protein